MRRSLLVVLGAALLGGGSAWAQGAAATQQQEEKADDVVKREEVVVVTASRVESTLTNAPATMSVLTSDTITNSTAQNFGDLLRSVPGMNVIQMSARDINLTSRQSTGTLATSTLVLLDGRSVYLDFFGLVLWDLVPTNPNEIKQIEVVRGPASAVWGANALTGVVNILTKTPREVACAGGGSAPCSQYSLVLSGGIFSRDEGSRADDGDGNTVGLSASMARAVSDSLSFKLSGGYVFSDPYSRPVGQVPVITDPRVANARCTVTTLPNGTQSGSGNCVGGGFYPIDGTGTFGTAFENEGTSQPKVDLRVDQEFTDGGRISYSGGYGGSKGLVHTGIGPFNIQNGSYMAYGRVGYSKGALKLGAFGNFLDVEAPNLLNLDPATLRPVELNFTTQTYDFEIGHSTVFAGKHVLSYGGNVRRNNFEITLTPNVEDRTELGAYVQEEFFLDKFRLTAGIRVDKFGNIEDPVFSPRVTAMVKPAPDHAFRASYNKAFRSPSAVNNFLDQDIFSPTFEGRLTALAPLAPAPLRPSLARPFRPRINIFGNPDLQEESLTAYELSYTGTFKKNTTIGLAVYQNDSDDNINFTFLIGASSADVLRQVTFYTPASAPAVIGINDQGQPVSGLIVPFLLAVPPQFGGPIRLPHRVATYLNLGPLRQRGVEVSVDHRFNNDWTLSANYSFQDEPEALDPDSGQLPYLTEELALPAKNRVNAAISWNTSRFVGSASVNYTDEAFWSDVLTTPYFGFTDAYTMLNLSFGVKWADGRIVTMLKGSNLTNETIQQHIFGDILKRSIVGEVRVNF
jgi:iron complex outermembrane receptor protein